VTRNGRVRLTALPPSLAGVLSLSEFQQILRLAGSFPGGKQSTTEHDFAIYSALLLPQPTRPTRSLPLLRALPTFRPARRPALLRAFACGHVAHLTSDECIAQSEVALGTDTDSILPRVFVRVAMEKQLLPGALSLFHLSRPDPLEGLKPDTSTPTSRRRGSTAQSSPQRGRRRQSMM